MPALREAVIVIVDVPAPEIDVGLKFTVTPVGSRSGQRDRRAKAARDGGRDGRATAPCVTETEVGEAERVKLGGAVTVRETVAVCVGPPGR